MRAALVFGGCFVFWLLLSGHYGVLEVAAGVLSAALVTFLTRDIELLSEALRVLPRSLVYLAWLLKEIARSNIEVARVVLSPRLPVDPVMRTFRAPFDSPLALTALGNSITLTPGTVTVGAEGQDLTVHSLLGPDAIAGIETDMARRVATLFGEPPP